MSVCYLYPIFALLTLAKKLAEKPATATKVDPSAPSSQMPPYQKSPGKARPKPKGARPGHHGHRRPPPPRIDRREEHTLANCPRCHGPVRPCRSSRARVIEDIPADITPVVTAHTIHRYWCPNCRTTVEPAVTDALPGSAIGLRVVVLSVMVRKNCDANNSTDGAETQAVLMSVFRTLKQRGHNPVSAVLGAVRAYLRTSQLPPLPVKIAEVG